MTVSVEPLLCLTMVLTSFAFGWIHINRSHGVVHQLARVGADEVATHHLHQFLLLLRRGFIPNRTDGAGCPAAEIDFGHDVGINIARHRRFITDFKPELVRKSFRI